MSIDKIRKKYLNGDYFPSITKPNKYPIYRVFDKQFRWNWKELKRHNKDVKNKLIEYKKEKEQKLHILKEDMIFVIMAESGLKRLPATIMVNHLIQTNLLEDYLKKQS